MSLKAMTCAMALRGVSPSEKLLLLALANYADDEMRCYPSQKRLADDTCLTDRTIRSLLGALEERKIISRAERARNDGSRATDIITLYFHGEVSAPEGVPEIISGGAEVASGGYRKQFPGGAEIISALTTFEPVTEPSPNTAAPPSTPPARRAAWERDEIFAKAWDACTAQMRKRSKSRALTWNDWKTAAPLAGGRAKLLAALLAYLRDDPDVKRTGGPGFHIWLNEGTWDAYLGRDAPGIDVAWNGPATIRTAVALERGEGFAAGYIDPATWTGEAVRARTRYAANELRQLYAMKPYVVLDPLEAAA